MLRVAHRVLVVLLLVGITPGVSELIGDAMHLALEGHTVHADAHLEHDAPAPEHGCTGWHHTCPCHTTVPFVAVAELPLPPATRRGLRPWIDPRDRGPEGVSAVLDQPPKKRRTAASAYRRGEQRLLHTDAVVSAAG